MNTTDQPTAASLLKWIGVALLSVTVVPLLAVVFVLPFAGRVAAAFDYSSDVAAPQVTPEFSIARTLDFFFGSLSTSTQSFPSGTITGKVTGGGTISADDPRIPPRSRSFGYVAMGQVVIDSTTGASNCTAATPCPAKGHLNYVNHTTGVHINGEVTEITNFQFFPTPPGPTKGTATFRGTDTKSGCGTFTVSVTDNGEPGTNDRFGIDCGGETTFGQRQHSGGNSQIHPTQAK
jgi:hypothetical protein